MTEEVMQGRQMACPILSSIYNKLVAKVAIITSLAAALVLLFLQSSPIAQWLTENTQVTDALNSDQIDLVPALLVIGVCLVCIVGLTTWIIVLYNSFRVAGPLYSFFRYLDEIFGLP